MTPWYKHWWGIAIIFIASVFLLSGTAFALYVAKLVKDIRSQQPLVSQPSSTNSSVLVNRSGNVSGTSPASVKLATDDDPSIGPKTAKITIVEFSDFQCPYCRESFPVLRELESIYSDKVRFIYRDFPIQEIHQYALAAAVAAECADDQKKFWAYHDKLFLNQSRLDTVSLREYARQVGLDENKFNECFSSGKHQAEVEDDFQDGLAAGVTGTPTWFVNGRKIEGFISLADFKRAIDSELARVK